MPLKRYKGKGLFKRTKEEIEAEKEKQKAKAKARKTKKLERLTAKVKNLLAELNKNDEKSDSAEEGNIEIQDENKMEEEKGKKSSS